MRLWLLHLSCAQNEPPKGKKEKKPKKEKAKKKNKKKGKGSLNAADAAEMETLQKIWSAVDADGSGTLDEDEVRKVMADMGKVLDDAEFAAAMAEIDEDGSGELDFDEFLGWWQNQDPEAQKQLELLMELDFDDL